MPEEPIHVTGSDVAENNPTLEELLRLGFDCFQNNQLLRAEEAARQALQLDPRHPVVLHFLGVVLRRSGNNKEALNCFRQAILEKPDYSEALFNYGNTLRDEGQLRAARSSYEKVISVQPDFVEAYYNLAGVLEDQGHHADALMYLHKVISMAPTFAQAYNNSGVILLGQEKWEEAQSFYEQAIAIQPDFAQAHNNLGVVLGLQKKYDQARASYIQAIKLHPDYPEVYNNLGMLLNAQNKYDEAEAAYIKALELQPSFAEAYYNWGVTLEGLNKREKARDCYQKAIELNPSYAEAHWNLSIFFLQDEDFRHGWLEYEWGLEPGGVRVQERKLPCPLWQGEDLVGKEIFIYAEQGVGDEVLFASCLADLRKCSAAKIFLECDLRLAPVFRRSFPGIHVCGKIRKHSPLHKSGYGVPNEQDLSWMGEDAQLDYGLPIGSLPKHFRNEPSDFPERASFLCADEQCASAIRADYAKRWPGKRLIGISWRSGNQTEGATRSLTLEQLSPILSRSDCQFINLQYGDVADELEAFHASTGINIANDPSIDPLRDLDRFFAQMAALDLVVTIDNSTAHFAGALGLPTRVLLPFVPNWRWPAKRSNSLWYSSPVLCRQDTPDNWDGVVEQVLADFDIET